MKIKQYIKTVSLLSFSLLLSIGSNTFVLKANSNPFDYSREGSIDTTIIDSDEFVEQIIGEEISSIERDYLRNNGYDLKYEGRLASSLVSTSVVGQEITIHAEEYSYVDKNNDTVIWIPYQASIDGITQNFEKDGENYVCLFENTSKEDLNITYKSSLSFACDDVNQLINSAYYTAKYYVDNDVLAKEKEEYDLNYERYLNDKEKYEKYLKDLDVYLAENVIYEEYLSEKVKYDEKLEEYNKYLLEVEDYNKELVEYNNYLIEVEEYESKVLAYQNYLIEKAKYDEKYALYLKQYEEYKPKKEKVDYQLGAMDLIVTSMTSMQRNVYDAVMGGTVTEVLARKDELVQLNADAAAIDDAEDATYALRDIFSSYFSLYNEESRYTYYKANYSSIKGNIEKLLRSLEKLYRSGLVSTAIEMFEKTDQYLILVAQLALISNAIDDKPVYNYEGYKNPSNKNAEIIDNSWTIENKTIMQILEYDVSFTDVDGNAYPLLSGYPKAPIEPEKIKELEEPKYPQEVAKPVLPEEVKHPGEAPKEIAKPVRPTHISEPKEPAPYVEDEYKASMIEAYNNKVLQERNLFYDIVNFEIYTSFIKNTSNLDFVSIEFYDLDNNFIEKYTTDYGSYIIFDKKVPVCEADEKYSEYVFSHWEYEDGEKLDLNCVTREGFVYPVFVGKTLQQYEITWIVEDKTYTEMYEYGEIPVFKEKLSKAPEGKYYYEFNSWDKELTEVISSNVYVASFARKNIVGENIEIVDGLKVLTLEVNDKTVSTIDVEKLFDIYVSENNSKKLIVSSETYLIEFSISVVSNMKKDSIKMIDLSFENTNEYEQFIQIKLFDNNDLLLSNSYSASIKVLGNYSAKSNLYKVLKDGKEEEQRASISNNMVSFTLQTNEVYHIYALNKIVVSSNDAVTINVSKMDAKYGEIIDFELIENVPGIIVSVYVIDSNGKNLEINNNSFIMPNNNIYIIISYEYILYNITFKVEDEIVSSEDYKYGEIVEVPTDPIKASDGKYTYKFIGWDKDVLSVTEDMVYSAVFEKQEIEKPINPNEGKSVLKTIKIAGLIGVGVIVVTVFVIVVFKGKSKKNKKQANKKEIAIKFD